MYITKSLQWKPDLSKNYSSELLRFVRISDVSDGGSLSTVVLYKYISKQ